MASTKQLLEDEIRKEIEHLRKAGSLLTHGAGPPGPDTALRRQIRKRQLITWSNYLTNTMTWTS